MILPFFKASCLQMLALSLMFAGHRVQAAETAATLSAQDLAARLSAIRQDGSTYVRLRLDVEEPPGTKKAGLQLQIKSRRTKSVTELVYQIIWPKERKGESVLLRRSGNSPATGYVSIPGSTLRALDASQMKQGLYGSDITYEDLLDDFFAWDQQTILGTEQVGKVNCQILESKPGSAQSSYTSVKTWVDVSRLVPLRVEKYTSAGQRARLIETTDVASTEKNTIIPANVVVHGSGNASVTTLDGSKIKYDVNYTDKDFSPEALSELSMPR